MAGKDFLSRQKLLNTVTKSLHNAEDPATVLAMLQRNLPQLQHALQEDRLGHRRPFICKPCQLDTTQPEDFGYGSPEWQEWRAHGVCNGTKLLKKDFPHNLSVYRNLSHFVLGKHVVWNVKHKGPGNFGVIPEISGQGNRRCCFIRKDGSRCMYYSDGVVCLKHRNLVGAIPYMSNAFVSSIKSEPLRVAFEKHLNNPDYKNVRNEVALMRTMLDALLHRIDASCDLTNIPFAELAAVTQMCQHITKTVETMANIETKMNLRLDLNQVNALILNVVNLVVSVCAPSQEKLAMLADGIENLPMMQTTVHSVMATREYGMDNNNSPVKNSTALAKYEEDGSVNPEGFTQEEFRERQAEVAEHYKTRGARYQEKLAHDAAKNEAQSPTEPPAQSKE